MVFIQDTELCYRGPPSSKTADKLNMSWDEYAVVILGQKNPLCKQNLMHRFRLFIFFFCVCVEICTLLSKLTPIHTQMS